MPHEKRMRASCELLQEKRKKKSQKVSSTEYSETCMHFNKAENALTF